MSVVVPLAGTWIEILQSASRQICFTVVPLAGTWIEIAMVIGITIIIIDVPIAGTWIEIPVCMVLSNKLYGRPPRGDVD